MPKSKKTKLFLVDDHMVVIEGIEKFLSDKAEYEIVGHAGDGLEAVRQVKALNPDIVIMDLTMPNFNGIEATHEIRNCCPDVKIVVYSMSSDKQFALSVFRAGVSGYVLKSSPLKDLLMALDAAKNGGAYYSRDVEMHIRDHMQGLESREAAKFQEDENDISRLSLREKEVFPLLADGKSISEIADILCISPKTVESHKYNIMDKLGVSSIAGLTKIAIKNELIKLE